MQRHTCVLFGNNTRNAEYHHELHCEFKTLGRERVKMWGYSTLGSERVKMWGYSILGSERVKMFGEILYTRQ